MFALRESRSDSHGREGAHLTTILLVGTASVGRIGSIGVQSNRDGLGAIDADDVEDQKLLDRVEAVGELDSVFLAVGQSLRWGLGSDLTIDLLVGFGTGRGFAYTETAAVSSWLKLGSEREKEMNAWESVWRATKLLTVTS